MKTVFVVILQIMVSLACFIVFGPVGLLLAFFVTVAVSTYPKFRRGDWSLSPRENLLKMFDGARAHVYKKYGQSMTREQSREVDRDIEKYKCWIKKWVFV